MDNVECISAKIKTKCETVAQICYECVSLTDSTSCELCMYAGCQDV